MVLESFHLPLLHRWQFVVHTLWLQCETWINAALAGAFLTLFFVWSATQSVWSFCIVIQHHNWAAHPLSIDNSGALKQRIFLNFYNGLIDFMEAFYAVLCLKHSVIDWKYELYSQSGSLFNSWGHLKNIVIFLLKRYALVIKGKQTSIRKN